MSYCVVEGKITSLGFCCPYSYLYSVRNWGTDVIAKELGVTRRTANRWKRDYNTDKLSCDGCKRCFFKAPLEPQISADSSLAHALDRDRTLADVQL